MFSKFSDDNVTIHAEWKQLVYISTYRKHQNEGKERRETGVLEKDLATHWRIEVS